MLSGSFFYPSFLSCKVARYCCIIINLQLINNNVEIDILLTLLICVPKGPALIEENIYTPYLNQPRLLLEHSHSVKNVIAK